MSEHFQKPLPIAALPLTSAVEPLVHNLQHLAIKLANHLEVAADTVIIIVSLQLLSQFLEYRRSPKLTALLLDPVEYCR